MKPYQIYIVYLIILSVITLIAYFIDKIKAKAKAWRLQEKTLLALSLLGGAYGGLIGVFTLRHKTKHWYFPFVNFIGAIIHTVGIIILYTLG